MIEDDRAANRFLEDIKSNLTKATAGDADAGRPLPTAHVTINRAVRCTIIVGQPPEQQVGSRRRTPRKS